MNELSSPGPEESSGFWLDLSKHREWLAEQANRQLTFFAQSLQPHAGFATLENDGTPRADKKQELHTTTRLVHSFALGQMNGYKGAAEIVDHGMTYLSSHHRDRVHGGYVWALNGDDTVDSRKLAYGHVFVLLAASSAKMAGHPEADSMLADISDTLEQQFWEQSFGLFSDERNQDWTPFSTYRGMNANMHAIEALLTAHEATGQSVPLIRAGRILNFFIDGIAPRHGWRLPEHYTQDWKVDETYQGDPMFRPAGSTPGHSFELGRLLLQYWDLKGRPDDGSPAKARRLIEQALHDAWLPQGGFAYTLKPDGSVDNPSRYWWPVTEAIGAVAALIKLDRRSEDEVWYRRLWLFADRFFIDHKHGGWFPELDDQNKPINTIFKGKPDIYHSLQACLFPLAKRLSRNAG